MWEHNIKLDLKQVYCVDWINMIRNMQVDLRKLDLENTERRRESGERM